MHFEQRFVVVLLFICFQATTMLNYYINFLKDLDKYILQSYNYNSTNESRCLLWQIKNLKNHPISLRIWKV